MEKINYERKYYGLVSWCFFLMLIIFALLFLLVGKNGSRDNIVIQVNSALEELYIIPKHHIKDEPRLEEWAWNHKMRIMLKEKK